MAAAAASFTAWRALPRAWVITGTISGMHTDVWLVQRVAMACVCVVWGGGSGEGRGERTREVESAGMVSKDGHNSQAHAQHKHNSQGYGNVRNYSTVLHCLQQPK
jgi:hypothetical protein